MFHVIHKWHDKIVHRNESQSKKDSHRKQKKSSHRLTRSIEKKNPWRISVQYISDKTNVNLRFFCFELVDFTNVIFFLLVLSLSGEFMLNCELVAPSFRFILDFFFNVFRQISFILTCDGKNNVCVWYAFGSWIDV